MKIAGVEVRSSSRTSTSTRNPRPTPNHPHSTRKSQISYNHKNHWRPIRRSSRKDYHVHPLRCTAARRAATPSIRPIYPAGRAPTQSAPLRESTGTHNHDYCLQCASAHRRVRVSRAGLCGHSSTHDGDHPRCDLFNKEDHSDALCARGSIRHYPLRRLPYSRSMPRAQSRISDVHRRIGRDSQFRHQSRD